MENMKIYLELTHEGATRPADLTGIRCTMKDGRLIHLEWESAQIQEKNGLSYLFLEGVHDMARKGYDGLWNDIAENLCYMLPETGTDKTITDRACIQFAEIWHHTGCHEYRPYDKFQSYGAWMECDKVHGMDMHLCVAHGPAECHDMRADAIDIRFHNGDSMEIAWEKETYWQAPGVTYMLLEGIHVDETHRNMTMAQFRDKKPTINVYAPADADIWQEPQVYRSQYFSKRAV